MSERISNRLADETPLAGTLDQVVVVGAIAGNVSVVGDGREIGVTRVMKRAIEDASSACPVEGAPKRRICRRWLLIY